MCCSMTLLLPLRQTVSGIPLLLRSRECHLRGKKVRVCCPVTELPLIVESPTVDRAAPCQTAGVCAIRNRARGDGGECEPSSYQCRDQLVCRRPITELAVGV